MPSPISNDLIFAVRFSSIEKVKELLAQGADVNAKDSIGNTPLIYAAGTEGRVEIARLLLDKGARIDETNNWGDSALIRSIDWDNSTEMVRLLLERGASTEIKNRGGYTAESMAVSRGRTMIVRMIKDAAETKRKQAEEKAKIKAAHDLAAERQKQLKNKKPPPSFGPK